MNRLVKGAVAGIWAGLLMACTAMAWADTSGHVEVQTLPAWGSSAHVVAAGGFYFAGQPDAAGFAQAAAAGVTTVINIRGPEEADWDVGAAVQQAGMAYFNEPLVLSEEHIDSASAARISRLVEDKGDGTVLIHCASGNRVAIWWALHLAAHKGVDGETAVALARQAGMKADLAPLVKQHLQPQSVDATRQ